MALGMVPMAAAAAVASAADNETLPCGKMGRPGSHANGSQCVCGEYLKLGESADRSVAQGKDWVNSSYWSRPCDEEGTCGQLKVGADEGKCTVNCEGGSSGLIFLYLPFMLYMFVGLAVVCEEYFVPSLNVLCERIKLPDDVAGATFMAAGASSPELFASLIGVAKGSAVVRC